MAEAALDSDALRGELTERALTLGFARIGVARAEALELEGERLNTWLEAGHHDQMTWMSNTREVRRDPRHAGMLPGAASVVVLATPFLSRQPGTPGVGVGRVARYAWGRDYHNVIGRRLRKLEVWLRDQGHAVRHSVDSRPVFERAWAVRAGVGFVGKNCCLIVPGLGSHVFLSTLVTTATLPVDAPLREGCGRCTACLDACPTGAFVAPRVLSAPRCISNLTIEREDNAATDLLTQTGDWLFGCDACQDVCPYNQTRPGVLDPAFAPHPRLTALALEDLLGMDEARFREWSEGSPLRRAGSARMARNAAVVLGNTGGRLHLPVLGHAATRHPSEHVRAAARWALGRIEARAAGRATDDGAQVVSDQRGAEGPHATARSTATPSEERDASEAARDTRDA
ncbi:MAG: tRNA epoxyqueuosine(34) reductase QueG [Polyangiales bacterium]|nr:tRNA epoxyqueuosine(34) reductase QueG [Myxococcales bacterium]MCB9661788.1 tRNA epoxyqueuosine(34) reductase QueG [Sandaracinaceae bacterium]